MRHSTLQMAVLALFLLALLGFLVPRSVCVPKGYIRLLIGLGLQLAVVQTPNDRLRVRGGR